jgi:hypothetical protein
MARHSRGAKAYMASALYVLIPRSPVRVPFPMRFHCTFHSYNMLFISEWIYTVRTDAIAPCYECWRDFAQKTEGT